MQKITKNILIATASIAVVTGAFFLIRSRVRKKQALLEEERLNQIREEQNTSLNAQLENQQSGETITNTSNGGSKITVSPVRNYNGEVINKYHEIMGRTLYPSQKSTNPSTGHKNALGYTNLRTSPEVNNISEWYDTKTNYLGRINTGKKIGIVVGEQYDDFDPKMRWFRVKLFTPIKLEADSSVSFTSTVLNWFAEPLKYAWVRADNVTFKPYEKTEKKSSFDGSQSDIENCGCLQEIQ